MRKLACVVAVVAASYGLAGCEDGPNQTYTPAPPNAAEAWNGPSANGIPEGATLSGSAKQGYDAGFGGTNANTLCTADQEKAIWSKAFKQPIQLPGLAAGLDIAGGYNKDGVYNLNDKNPYDPALESWTGATVEQAEKVLCQGTPDSVFNGVTNTMGWGNGCPNCEVSALYNMNNRHIHELIFQYGYQGGLVAKSSDGRSVYSIQLDKKPIQVSRGGAEATDLLLEWGSGTAAVYKTANEVYDALRNTYAPGFPPEPEGQTCQASGHCIVGNNLTQGGYLYFPPLSLAVYVENTTAPQPSASIINLIQLTLFKLFPFSVSGNLLKLDARGEGPISLTPNPSGQDPSATCKYFLGMRFGDFDRSCVQVYSGELASQNTVMEKKLLGGLTHSDETYGFGDVVGIDPQVVASTLPSDKVVADTDTPRDDDVIYEFRIDQNALGKLANDYTDNDVAKKKDLHGSGMLMLEWANLVQKYARENLHVTTDLGDEDCIANPAKPKNGKKCSGIEGILTTAPPGLARQRNPLSGAANAVATYPRNALGRAAVKAQPSYAAGFHPGTWRAAFCTDVPDATPPAGTGTAHGFRCTDGYMFEAMQDAAQKAFPSPTPLELQSRRFFFKQWIKALVKYLQSAEDPNADLGTIDANPVDEDNLFFDSEGGNFEKAEYVFRNTVDSAKQPPTVLDVATNLTTSVINDFTFLRYNLRGEKLLYSVLQTKHGEPGAEPLFLSNIVGSPVLRSAYPSYRCATNPAGDDECTPGVPGNPTYAGYEAAFGRTALHIAARQEPASPAPLTVDTQGPNGTYPMIRSAMVTLPIWRNPFDPETASPDDPTASALLTHVPPGASSGFSVTVDGSRDKFHAAHALALTGETLAGTLYYDFASFSHDDGTKEERPVVRALMTEDYLGLIFACARPSEHAPSPGSLQGADILAVRMYDNAADILGWIAKHPDAVDACGIQIKYSSYGNYPDFISFNNNGVRLGLNPGFGGAVVADAVLFDPNVVPGLGQ
jgi:hypothetical protein